MRVSRRDEHDRFRGQAIEKSLARKRLADGVLVLYDVTSSYVEGRCCSLAKLGYSRDGKKGKLQIVYGLLCAADGWACAPSRVHLKKTSEVGLRHW